MFIDRIISALSSSLLIGFIFAGALVAMPAPAHATDIGWRQSTILERESAGAYTRRGTATFKTGEVATVAVNGTNGPLDHKGRLPFKSQAVYQFQDGSTFTIRFAGSRDPASSAQDASGKFLSGTGRFRGIIGKFTFSGRIGMGEVGETEWVGSYSVPKR
jgi:hypothetical protein